MDNVIARLKCWVWRRCLADGGFGATVTTTSSENVLGTVGGLWER